MTTRMRSLRRARRWALTAAALALLAVVAGSGALEAQTRRQLRLASTAWSPFTNAPGQPRFALDLVDEALSRVKIAADTTIIAESRFTPALLSGEFDGSAAAWKDDERARVMVFSEPYLENRLVLVGRRGSDVSATTLSGLAGKRIAIVGGYSYGEAIEQASGPVYVRSSSEEDSLARLLKGEVDYTLMDDLVVQHLVRHHGEEARARLVFGVTPLVTRPLHLAIHRNVLDADAIVAQFNRQLRDMVADRTYHRLLHLQWIRADVDGDGQVEYIPEADRIGPNPPQQGYDLYLGTQKKPEQGSGGPQRFYFGGTVYDNWADVPDRYKDPGSIFPDTSRSSFDVFRFVW